MKFLFEKRRPAYLPLFLTAVTLGPAMGIFMVALLMRLLGNDIEVFQMILFLIIALPSAIVAYIITIIALRTEKGLSPFAAGIIGGISSSLVILIAMASLGGSSSGPNRETFLMVGLLFGIGFIAEISCFLLSSETPNEEAKETD